MTTKLKKMASGKAADQAGVVAEMLQKGGMKLAELMAQVFTDILRGYVEPPRDWKIASMHMLFKDGDEKEPANYRPICLLPII